MTGPAAWEADPIRQDPDLLTAEAAAAELESQARSGRVGHQSEPIPDVPAAELSAATAGADVLLLPAEWVPGPLKEDHWLTLLRARAIENTIYVAAADQSAPAGSGNSIIVDPMGVVLAALGERTAVATAQLTTDRLAEVRAKNPALALRRFTTTPLDSTPAPEAALV